MHLSGNLEPDVIGRTDGAELARGGAHPLEIADEPATGRTMLHVTRDVGAVFGRQGAIDEGAEPRLNVTTR